MAKVSFDGVNKLIIVNTNETALSVREDLYSDWKEWAASSDNLKFLPAFRAVGGDEISTGIYVGDYYFLMNGWKIRPYEGNHILLITGNLYVDGGGTPFVSTIGNYNVLISVTTSSKTEKVVLEGAGGIPQSDKDDIIEGVWAADEGKIVRKMLANKVVKSGNIVSIYDDDNTTVWRQYDLSDGGRVLVT